jgi:hypothetical protein
MLKTDTTTSSLRPSAIPIVDDHAAIAVELRQIQAARQLVECGIVLPKGFLRAGLIMQEKIDRRRRSVP